MARRAALSDIKTAIKIVEEDGGVILTGFSSCEDVERVNNDAAPYLKAIVENVGQR